MKKYDIVVFDGTKQRQENGVMANSPRELAGIYAMSDEKIQVIREYEDEDCRNYGKFDPNEILKQMNTPMATGQLPGTGMMKISDEMKEMLEKTAAASHQQNVPRGTQQPPVPGSFDGLIQPQVPPQAEPQGSATVVPIHGPVFFKVGDVECKLENGVVYQKHWTRASDEDLMSIRVVSDKTGKEISLPGKHVEVMKWEIANDVNETVQPVEEAQDGEV